MNEVLLRLVFVSVTPTVDCFIIPGASERPTRRCPIGRTRFSLVKSKSKVPPREREYLGVLYMQTHCAVTQILQVKDIK